MYAGNVYGLFSYFNEMSIGQKVYSEFLRVLTVTGRWIPFATLFLTA